MINLIMTHSNSIVFMTAYRATGELDVLESIVIVLNDSAESGLAQTSSCVPQEHQQFRQKVETEPVLYF